MPGKKMRSIKNDEQYESIKKKLLADGVPLEEAKTRAAKITNAQAGRKKKR